MVDVMCEPKLLPALLDSSSRVRGVNFTIYTLQVNYSKFTVKIIGALHRAPHLYIGCDVV